MGSMPEKANVLLVGSGGVGTMGAYALETGGSASVTAILRSNYAQVEKGGFNIDSIDHGKGIKSWRPTTIRNTVPDVAKESLKPFDYIVVTTKNVPDVPPTVTDIVEPAVTPGHSVIVLVQNGLNIEKPLLEKFPDNIVLSGVSMIGATETAHGDILHDDNDNLKIGAYTSPNVPIEKSEAAAKKFIDIYNACGKVECIYDDNVPWTRWRKLVYNASFNSVATILQLDTTRMRIYEHIIDDLIRPAMNEIIATASAAGITLPEGISDFFITADPPDAFFKPSMCQDIMKGNYIEMETIVGEPVRESERLGVPTPVLHMIYGVLKGLQAKTKESKGLLVPKKTPNSKYI